MRVLVDTSVWSMALRKNNPVESPYIRELKELIRELRVVIIGPVRQELLSGIVDKALFLKLREGLHHFEDEPLMTEHFEYAAELSNECCRRGIQGSHTDFLICAVAVKHDLSIFTLDKDYSRFKKHGGFLLHEIRKELR